MAHHVGVTHVAIEQHSQADASYLGLADSWPCSTGRMALYAGDVSCLVERKRPHPNATRFNDHESAGVEGFSHCVDHVDDGACALLGSPPGPAQQHDV